MNVKRLVILTAFSAAAILMTGDRAHATYSYATSITTTSATGGATFTNTAAGTSVTLGGTTVNLLDTSHGPFFVPGSATLDVADVGLTSTTPIGPTGDNYSFNYNLTLTLTNTGPPGSTASQSFTVQGTITLSNLNMGNGTITNVFNTPTSGSNINIGGVLYTGAIGINPNGSNAFSAPTVNGGLGTVGGFVIANAVPEPASIGMMGAGLLGVLGFGITRSRKANRSA